MKINNTFKLIVAIGVSLSAGAIGSVFTTPAVQSDWYLQLIKPALNPPAWVFAPAWTTLYVLMGIALFLVWSSYAPVDAEAMAGKKASADKNQHSHILQNVRMLRMQRWGIFSFFLQLALNAAWSIIFFGLHSPGWALVGIVLLWLAIVWTMVVFYKISRPAAYLLVPYLLWVSFASYLNYAIWMLN